MLNLEKIYKTRGPATKALNAAIKEGILEAAACEITEVEGGFQIREIEPLTTKAAIERKARQMSEMQKKALMALHGAKSLAGMTDGERADVWFPFAEIYESEKPCNLSARSMGGIMRGLMNRDYVRVATDYVLNGKRVVAVSLTIDGLAAAQAS